MSQTLSGPQCPYCGNANPAEIQGHQVSGVYDGVLYWVCLDCLRAFARDWTGYGTRQQLADEYVATYNSAGASY